MGEYGRLLDGARQKNSSVVPKGDAPKIVGKTKPRESTPGPIAGDPLPAVLTVESKDAVLYARSEDWSEKVTQLSAGEKLQPIIRATGTQGLWYMVKTQAGSTGWVKGLDVSGSANPK
jgi:hypothetical protein